MTISEKAPFREIRNRLLRWQRTHVTLRAAIALWLAWSVFYTPIHLALESHSDEVRPVGSAAALAVHLDHDDSHHDCHEDWHPASQHSFEALTSIRFVLSSVPVVAAAMWQDSVELRPATLEYRWQGLSPPELIRTWQFFTRAAPPVRAPSVIS